jgi:hypothetical protein
MTSEASRADKKKAKGRNVQSDTYELKRRQPGELTFAAPAGKHGVYNHSIEREALYPQAAENYLNTSFESFSAQAISKQSTQVADVEQRRVGVPKQLKQ